MYIDTKGKKDRYKGINTCIQIRRDREIDKKLERIDKEIKR